MSKAHTFETEFVDLEIICRYIIFQFFRYVPKDELLKCYSYVLNAHCQRKSIFHRLAWHGNQPAQNFLSVLQINVDIVIIIVPQLTNLIFLLTFAHHDQWTVSNRWLQPHYVCPV